MKITFLGCADGIPTKKRYCSCTMIETNGSIYLIDAGAPVIDQLLRFDKNVNDLRVIFLTHYHGDHCDGMLSLLGLTTWAFKDAKYDIYATEQPIIDAFTACSEATSGKIDTDRVKFHIAQEGQVYKDENITVTYFRNHHCDPHPSYSILVECEGKKVFFSGDLSTYLNRKDFPKYVLENHVDALILEFTHFTIYDVGEILPNIKTDKLYFNHTRPPFFETIDQIKTENKLPYFIHAADDGDIIEL